LGFGEENVTFPRMNYRRKKISLKEQLEEAIEENRRRAAAGSGFERETPEEEFSEIEPGAPELRKPHLQAHRRNAVQPCLTGFWRATQPRILSRKSFRELQPF
jgi:hypothetical protein